MMHSSCLTYHDDSLYIEEVKLEEIASRYGTPCYVYSAKMLENNWHSFTNAFRSIPNIICYAVKANSNLAILHLLTRLGSGFDIVSLGELERVIKAGGSPDKIVFSGVGKQTHEITKALEYSIHCIDVESISELERINNIAGSIGKIATIALRVNPNIDAKTHAHITTGLDENKFGININNVLNICQQLTSMKNVKLTGLAAHIGSQITEIKPFSDAIDQLLQIYQQLKELNIEITTINIGGGLGITYYDEKPPSLTDYATAIIEKINMLPITLILEPGRSIIGNAGILLTTIEYIKETDKRNFAIVDAGMNDLLRPALYDAWQPILPVTNRSLPMKKYDVAGPVCESADFLGKDRELAIMSGDLLAIDCAGAYGFSMSSNYNSRCRPAEILVTGKNVHLIRHREQITDLFAHEVIPSFDYV